MAKAFKRLTLKEKAKLRRKAMEALSDENYGDDGDGFHEHATAQAVIGLIDEISELKAEITAIKTGAAATPAPAAPALNFTLPDVEKWRSVDQVRAQQAYRVLVERVIADAAPDNFVNALIAAIEKEQDRLHDEGYLMDSKDCIDVIREVVKQQERK